MPHPQWAEGVCIAPVQATTVILVLDAGGKWVCLGSYKKIPSSEMSVRISWKLKCSNLVNVNLCVAYRFWKMLRTLSVWRPPNIV